MRCASCEESADTAWQALPLAVDFKGATVVDVER